jgi:hypothetical protein
MVVRLASALRFATAVLLLGPALASAASAQDVMQLDLAFKDSLQRGAGSERPAGYQEGRGRTASEARQHGNAVRRHPRRHRHKT